MLLHQLIRAERHAPKDLPKGYSSQKVGFVLKITPEGVFLGFEKQSGSRDIPKIKRTRELRAQTLFDDATYVFGTGKVGHGREQAAARYIDYREKLAGCPGPYAKAILKFLDNGDRPIILPLGCEVSEEDLETLARIEPAPVSMPIPTPPLQLKGELTTVHATLSGYACLLANAKANHPAPETVPILPVAATAKEVFFIEVVGLEGRHLDADVRAYHLKRLEKRNNKGKEPLIEPCSMCYQERPIARLFPKVKGMLLVSFKHQAWQAYGREQGYNVPTCTDCVDKMARGLEHILSSKAHKINLSRELGIVWWADDLKTPPAELLNTILDPKTSEADRASALGKLPDTSHLMLVETMTARTALQRFYTVDGQGLRGRIQHWLDTMGPMPIWQAGEEMVARHHDGHPANAEAVHRARARLHMILLAGEIPLPLDVQHTNKADRMQLHNGERRRNLRAFFKQESPMDVQTVAAEQIDASDEEAADALITPPSFYDCDEKYYFLLGVMFGKAEANQMRSQTAQPLGSTHLQGASRGRQQALSTIDRYSNITIGKRRVTDNFISSRRAMLTQYELEMGRKAPKKASGDLRQVMIYGYSCFRAWDRERIKAAVAAKAVREAAKESAAQGSVSDIHA